MSLNNKKTKQHVMNKYNAGGIAPHAADLEIICG
jgi:hypothetical protein